MLTEWFVGAVSHVLGTGPSALALRASLWANDTDLLTGGGQGAG